MKSTLADIKQLFNVKAIAYNTNINALDEGQFGVFPEDSDVSVPAGTTFATLPAKFRIISKLNGKIYYSFDTIEKSKVFNQVASPYKAEQVNVWEGIIEHCNCINGVQLVINIDEQSLIQRDGLTWTHRDFVVAVSPQELLCHCACDGTKAVYENNILTKLLFEKINALNSPFYEAEVVQEDGTPVPDVAAFVLANEAVNTDADDTNDGPKLKLVIKGKPQPAGLYRDLEVNYVYPRGVRLNPAVHINNELAIQFTQTQALGYEIGAGYDLRAEEFESMSLYTNMNFYPRLSDGIQSPDLVYQFENNKNYDTVTFEFYSKKSGLEDVPEGRYKKFGVLLGAEDGSAEDGSPSSAAMTAMFVV